MRRRKVLIVSVASVALSAALSISVAMAAENASGEPIGRITAAFGVASIQDAGGKHSGDLHALIKNDDRIMTDGGGISVLLASRVVVKVDAKSCISVRETSGETNVILEYGTCHIYVGQRPDDAGVVSLLDGQSRLETSNGVFLASYNPATQHSYYACEHAALTIKPREGTASGEPVCTLAGDEQASVSNGKLESCGAVDRIVYLEHQRALEQLGQSIVEQGTTIFRLRSRTFDTDNALTQLAAVNLIDKQALTKSKSSNTLGKKKQNNSTDNNNNDSDSTADSGNNNNSTNTTLTSGNTNGSANTVTAPPSATVDSTPAPSAPSAPPVAPANDPVVSDAGSGADSNSNGNTVIPGKVDLGLGNSDASDQGNDRHGRLGNDSVANSDNKHGGKHDKNGDSGSFTLSESSDKGVLSSGGGSSVTDTSTSTADNNSNSSGSGGFDQVKGSSSIIRNAADGSGRGGGKGKHNAIKADIGLDNNVRGADTASNSGGSNVGSGLGSIGGDTGSTGGAGNGSTVMGNIGTDLALDNTGVNGNASGGGSSVTRSVDVVKGKGNSKGAKKEGGGGNSLKSDLAGNGSTRGNNNVKIDLSSGSGGSGISGSGVATDAGSGASGGIGKIDLDAGNTANPLTTTTTAGGIGDAIKGAIDQAGAAGTVGALGSGATNALSDVAKDVTTAGADAAATSGTGTSTDAQGLPTKEEIAAKQAADAATADAGGDTKTTAKDVTRKLTKAERAARRAAREAARVAAEKAAQTGTGTTTGGTSGSK